MSRDEAIERRLSAVERAIADGDGEVAGLADAGDREQRLRAVEDRLEAIEASVTDLEAATQALRGYVGNVRSVNRDVEQRADAALAAVERLEARLGETGKGGGSRYDGPAGERQRSNLDRLDAGAEMPVPGTGTGTRSSDPGSDVSEDGTVTDEGAVTDDGVLERVRDAL